MNSRMLSLQSVSLSSGLSQPVDFCREESPMVVGRERCNAPELLLKERSSNSVLEGRAIPIGVKTAVFIFLLLLKSFVQALPTLTASLITDASTVVVDIRDSFVQPSEAGAIGPSDQPSHPSITCSSVSTPFSSGVLGFWYECL